MISISAFEADSLGSNPYAPLTSWVTVRHHVTYLNLLAQRAENTFRVGCCEGQCDGPGQCPGAQALTEPSLAPQPPTGVATQIPQQHSADQVLAFLIATLWP